MNVGGGDGTLAIIVWPTYVGAAGQHGAEPADNDDYERGQITWLVNAAGEPYGHAQILVPPGVYTDLCYFHHPRSPLMIGYQHLAQPFDFRVAGVINVEHITKADFTQVVTPNGFRLPLAQVGKG